MKRIVLPLILLLCSTLLLAASDYSIESLESRVVINEEGAWDVKETIVMHFHKPLHGFYRQLPNNRGKRKVTWVEASGTLAVSLGQDDIILRIGDANKTVTGRQVYTIGFRYDIGAGSYLDYDEFYYNLVGDGWEVPIEEFTFSITFPKPIEREKISFATGKVGSVSSKGVNWSLSPDRLTIEGSVAPIEIGEALTVRVEMEEGYYKKYPTYGCLLRPAYWRCNHI